MNTKQNDKIKVLSKGCTCSHDHGKPKLSSKVITNEFMDKLAAKQGVKRLIK